MIIRLKALFVLTLAVCPVAFGQSVSVPLTDNCKVQLASAESGRELISANDSFMNHMQDAERRIRMKSNEPKTIADLSKSLKSGVKDFSESEIKQLTDVIKEIRDKTKEYKLPFPDRIHLVRATSDVEFDAPHCRGASIVLPDGFFGPPRKMITVLTHELFHVLSSHNPKLRDELYSVIGFSRCNEIELPAELKQRRLTNPDAPVHEHVINVTLGKKKISVVPITLLRTTKYESDDLMKYLDFQLMEVTKQGEKFVPVLNDGKPVLVSAMRPSHYIKQIGRNTGYIIHPEETLADNFWMMVLQRPELPDQWVVDEMKKILQKKD